MSDDFCIYRNAPLLRYYRSLTSLYNDRFRPIHLGIVFFVIVSLSLTIFTTVTEYELGEETSFCTNNLYLSYWCNISWSISIIFIFPFVIGLTLKYYDEIPLLFSTLAEKITEEQKSELDIFYQRLDFWCNSYFIALLIFLFVTYGNYCLYYFQILNEPVRESWIANSENTFGFLYEPFNKFSRIGLYASLIQLFLIYWVAQLVYKSIVVGIFLYSFFNLHKFNIELDPLHHDGLCGLSIIGRVTRVFNYILFLLGIYISLKVIDKIIVSGNSLMDDIGNPIFLTLYIFLAPLLFFLPLAAAHNRMTEMKQNFIKPYYKKLSSELRNADNASTIDYNRAVTLQVLIEKWQKTITVWPFNMRSIETFIAIVIIPFVPTVLAAVFDFIFQNAT